MAAIIQFSNQEKTIHNSHKFSSSLKPTNYGYWRSMIESFLTSHNLFCYVDGTVPCPEQKVTNKSFLKTPISIFREKHHARYGCHMNGLMVLLLYLMNLLLKVNTV
uniref:Retrotransposon Copia-like N-terminal domain-containing protein n=1 Tax=Lactuca sativa TaxID=4236 RepID=A0A9R1VEE7_LACSA|nr:hypothetical protein LSAT_V11C500269810 [Lactuca sativa]